MRSSYLENYLRRLGETAAPAVASVRRTIVEIVPNHLESFSHKDHVTGLLLGEVQSGKTSQMFGIIAAAADSGFDLFIVLSTDNNTLQKQTYARALNNLDGFNVCDESDDVRFMQKNMREPAVVVLKKNTTILKRWKNILGSSGFAKTRPLFIVDDEADAASLNTKINQDDQSTINMHLENMKSLATSSFYLQVTATPQPLLLQATASGWKPSFVHTFEPGKGYLGGSFFYSKPKAFTTVFTEDNELEIILKTKEVPEGLKKAVETFLVTGAHILNSQTENVCNFLVHPSIRIEHHEIIAEKTEGYIQYLLENVESKPIIDRLRGTWENLKVSKPEIVDFREIVAFLKNRPRVNVIILNSGPNSNPRATHDKGMNVVVGGNTLGRGVTFSGLQTVYYCRSARSPQADTFWQHSRMFGYDRDPRMMRVFIPMPLYNMFAEINNSNEILFKQIKENGFDNVHLVLPPGIKPTRLNVVDKGLLNSLVGGVNYFPPEPDQKNSQIMDRVLERYGEGPAVHDISISEAKIILSNLSDDKENEWLTKSFISALDSVAAEKGSIHTAKLIIRRKRDIGRKTGTLLSEDDRKLGDMHTSIPVITFYRLLGSKDKGWDGNPFWVPNIKLPKGKVFFRVD